MNPIGYWIDVDSLLGQLSDHAEDASRRYFHGYVNDRDALNRALGEMRAFRTAVALLRDYRDSSR